jgi:hypothetical protein
MDSSLDVTIAKNKSDRMSKPLSAIHHVADVVLGPSEDSSTGKRNGRAQACPLCFGHPASNGTVPKSPGNTLDQSTDL